jgi:hypothetical protein
MLCELNNLAPADVPSVRSTLCSLHQHASPRAGQLGKYSRGSVGEWRMAGGGK